jgi:crotonobetainyl-CoA:carnitine CoA-transferase CaiB-like acyl-CoA transferase
MRVENAPFRSALLPEPEIAPAPEMGEHTRELARELLKLDEADIERLIALDVLQEGVSSGRDRTAA